MHILNVSFVLHGYRLSTDSKERLNFYHRLGFAAEDTVQRYALDGLPEEK